MARKGPAGIFRRIIQLVVDAEAVRKAKAAMQDALNKGTDATGLKRNLSGIDKAFTKLKVGAIALGAAIGTALVLGFRKVIGESIEMQKILAQQEAVLKSTGEAAGRNAKQLQDQANALQRLTTFTDDQVTAAQNLLLTFRHLREQEFDKAVEVTLDFATAMGTDATTAALQLGKALEDPITGLNSLRRSGVSFSQSQRDVIKQLVETGRTAEAQRLILAELEVQFGGSAEAARNTLGGALEGLKNAWNDLFEVSRDSSSGIIGAINLVAAAIPKIDRAIEITLKSIRDAIKATNGEMEFALFAPPSLGAALRGAGGMGDVRIAEGADDADERRKKAAAARAAAEAEEARRAAAAAAAEAARKEAEERRRAEDARINALEALHKLGVASIDDTMALIQAQASLKSALQQANVTLEERARLWGQIQEIQETLDETRFAARERTPPAASLPHFGITLIPPDQIKPIEHAAGEAAGAVENAWLEAFENIKGEGEALAMVLGEVMAGTGESFMSIIAKIAPAKAKENFVRAIEAAGAGLARLVLYGDAAGAAAGAKAAALHTAAGIGWQALGGGGGGGKPTASFASGLGGVGAAGRAADRTTPQGSTTVYVYVDPFDPKNGVHQQKVGDAVVLWQQRQSPMRRR